MDAFPNAHTHARPTSSIRRTPTARSDARHDRHQGGAHQAPRVVATLTAIIRLLLTLLRIFGGHLDGQRLSADRDKSRLLRAIRRTRAQLPLGFILKLLRLSPSRYHVWKQREVRCELTDHSPCPKTTPQGLTLEEVQAMGEMVTSDEYRHISIATLALHAQRLGRVIATATTWRRLIRQRGWLRPRRRLYPAKPKVGLRQEFRG